MSKDWILFLHVPHTEKPEILYVYVWCECGWDGWDVEVHFNESKMHKGKRHVYLGKDFNYYF